MEYSFIHPETKKPICFKTEKKNIIIYGKNGSGKTSFTKSNLFDEAFVFNEKFVNKNIYIVGADGAKTDADTKSGFSSLWIGEDTIKIKKHIENCSKLKMACIESTKTLAKKTNPSLRVYLGASLNREGFYEKFGFVTREKYGLGSGMILNNK